MPFKISISVKASNGEREYEQSVILDVEILPSLYGNISLDDEILQPLIGVPKESTQSTTITVRNDGNIQLTGDLSVVVIDDEGNEVSGWRPAVSPSSVSINPSDSIDVSLKLSPSEGVDRGPYKILVSLSSNGQVVTTFDLQASSSPAEGNGGLFNIVPWYVSVVIIAVLVATVFIVSRKLKRSGSFEDDDSQLVAADAYGVVPDAGSRREKALDIGISQDDMTSGEVSQEEIAAALAKSMADQFSAPAPNVNPPMPGLPPPGMPPRGMPPAGMPPLGKVPLGMPPVIQQKPLPITPQPVPAESSHSLARHCLLQAYQRGGQWHNGKPTGTCG